ncbi:glycosyltransferase [Kaistella solincola]|uniref:glycosyltransferase n=1 Tax=Kaistella solincola TaxID=510955 RepID=UPI00068A80F9|nr:glycosyltransferase [Kaistella solincola]
MNTSSVPVSVVIMTHRHEKFITEALEGVFLQHYEGPLQVIIVNDASPDETHEIIVNFLKKELPRNITVEYTRHEENKGMMANFAWALRQTRGKYTAFCEGDDYWTDPLKLQHQVDFLENHADYSLVFSNTRIFPETSWTHADMEMEIVTEDRQYLPEEIFEKWIVPLNTVLFRNDLEAKFYDLILHNKNLLFGDIVLLLHLAEKGKIFGMAAYTAVYRRHTGNVTSSTQSHNRRNKFNHLQAVIRAFGSRYKTPLVKKTLGRYSRSIATQSYHQGSFSDVAKYLYWAFRYNFKEAARLLRNNVRQQKSSNTSTL